MIQIIKPIIVLIMLLCISFPAFGGNETATSKVTASLPAIISVDSVFIEGKKLNSPNEIAQLEVHEIIKKSNTVNELRLSSIQYTIKSNTHKSIQILAEFISLSNSKYSFPNDRLSLEKQEIKESQETKTTKLSPKFIPVVEVTSDVPEGNYNGTIMLTITSL